MLPLPLQPYGNGAGTRHTPSLGVSSGKKALAGIAMRPLFYLAVQFSFPRLPTDKIITLANST